MRLVRMAIALQATVLAVGAACVSGAGATSVATAAPMGSASFTDPAGDAQSGPDVTRVAISGDATAGSVELTVTAPGFETTPSAGLEQDVLVWLDTDRNGSTGDPEDGTEYGLVAWNDASGRWWNITRWNGGAWESVPESATMRVTSRGDAVTWAVGIGDLGGATSFRFYVVAGTWNTTTERFDTRDEAPDSGFWSYDIAASTPPPKPRETKVSLIIRAPTTTPRAAAAGKPFSARFQVQLQKVETGSVIDLGTGELRETTLVSWEPPEGGRLVGKASVAGRVLPSRTSLKDGVARISFAVPKAAAGKLLRIAVTVRAADSETGKRLTATRVATFRIR